MFSLKASYSSSKLQYTAWLHPIALPLQLQTLAEGGEAGQWKNLLYHPALVHLYRDTVIPVIFSLSGHDVLAQSMFVCSVLIHKLSVCHLLSSNISDCKVKNARMCKDMQLQGANVNYHLYSTVEIHIFSHIITHKRRLIHLSNHITWRENKCCPVQYWTLHLPLHSFCVPCRQKPYSSSVTQTHTA